MTTYNPNNSRRLAFAEMQRRAKIRDYGIEGVVRTRKVQLQVDKQKKEKYDARIGAARCG